MVETVQELNATRSTATELVTSSERSISKTLNDAFNRIDALTDATSMAADDMSTNRRHIVSMVSLLTLLVRTLHLRCNL